MKLLRTPFTIIMLGLLAVSRLPTVAASANWPKLLANDDAWFRSDAGRTAVSNVVSWQSTHGSWPKNLDTTKAANKGTADKITGTFDNGATTGELRFLARAFQATHDEPSRTALLRGVDHILAAQYPNGGWPQFYPVSKQYHRHITFNDGSMVRVMELLRDVAGHPGFGFVDQPRKNAARAAFERGLGCIVKAQIVVDGRRTVWCAQHDETDLSPRPARAYELASLSGSESAGVLNFLMTIEQPSPEVALAIESGAAWFEAVRIAGLRQTKTNGDRVMVADATAPPLWARFYDIGSNRPFFCGRDGVKKYALNEIEAERRNGYAWYGNWGESVAKNFALWKQRQPAAKQR